MAGGATLKIGGTGERRSYLLDCGIGPVAAIYGGAYAVTIAPIRGNSSIIVGIDSQSSGSNLRKTSATA